MSELSQIGLGAMGSALARAQIGAGRQVTVWNRTARKMEPLVALGAGPADSVAQAVEASPVIMVCVDNYAITRRLLSGDDVAPHLAGQTVIQLSTGTPKEARETQSWLAERGADYLDGAIASYPGGIGDEDGRILVSGSGAAFGRSQDFFACLGGDIRYLGENVAAAAALDLAELSESLGKYTGLLHGARLCEAEGVSVDLLASLYPEGNRARELAEIVHGGDFTLGARYDGATVRVWEEVVQRLRTQARDAGMNSALPDFLSRLFKRAVAAGHGEEDIAALIKALRDGA
jgi:3-hydroxyisobutyrate dehydrogenase-like beta-hydroxyacid dehydrogenase